MILITLIVFINGICLNVVTVEVFPREKIGQFCSANQIFHSSVSLIVTPLLGMYLDRLKDYTYIYVWSAAFQLLAAAIFVKVY